MGVVTPPTASPSFSTLGTRRSLTSRSGLPPGPSPVTLLQIGQRFVIVRDGSNLARLGLGQIALERQDVEGRGDPGFQAALLDPELFLRQGPRGPVCVDPFRVRLHATHALAHLLDDLQFELLEGRLGLLRCQAGLGIARLGRSVSQGNGQHHPDRVGHEVSARHRVHVASVTRPEPVRVDTPGQRQIRQQLVPRQAAPRARGSRCPASRSCTRTGCPGRSGWSPRD